MRISREELYEIIWSEPMKRAAPKFGVSDVALSKVCRKHGIPRPPRGYWAKLAAGKPVRRVSLPPRGLGMPRIIDTSRYYRWHNRLPSDPEEIEIPAPPEFATPIEEVEATVKKKVGKVSVMRDLSQGHHLIRKLLAADEERKAAQAGKDYYSSLDAPLFESPYEQRRLRIANTIFLALGRCGARASFSGKDPDSFGFVVGEEQLSFKLDHPEVRRTGWRWEEDAQRSASLPMTLTLNAWRLPKEMARTWKDSPGKKLERQLSEIVTAMIVSGEMQYRHSEISYRERLIEHKARLIEEAKREAELERQRIEAERIRREQERVDRLLAEAASLQRAQTIRAYIDAARAANLRLDQPVGDEDFEAWAAWASDVANQLDPVLTRGFLKPDEQDRENGNEIAIES